MEDDLIYGIIFIALDSKNKIKLFECLPRSYEENEKQDICQIVVDYISKKIVDIPPISLIIPFPKIKLKGLIRFTKLHENTAALIVIFKEQDDLIFYKYSDDLEDYFDDFFNNIKDFSLIKNNIDDFYKNIKNKLVKLQEKEKEAEELKKEPDYRFKIIIAGDIQVGKTSLVLRFTDQAFNRTYIPTIGANLSNKRITLNGEVIHLIVWDIAGHSKFEKMRKNFYRGAEGGFLVFDLTNEKSFNNIKEWFADIKNTLNSNKPFKGFLLGNKNDLIKERKIKREDAERLAETLGLEYIETSALTGENVDDAFTKLAQEILIFKKR
ncbi:MAG: Rab family GTPase [Promethearchaeota archaeon]